MASRSIRWAGLFIIVLTLLLIFEVFSFAVFYITKDSDNFRIRVLYPVDLTDSEIQTYLKIRDDKLGWPSKNNSYLDNGSHRQRISPANKAITNPKICFEFYGDSFTYAADVDDRSAWPNRLAEKTKCKILNFGIGGYGVDQAMLRHELNERFADYAALVIYPHDIKRNLNQQRSLVGAYKKQLDYKPRFILSDNSGLELIEAFTGTLEDYKRVFDNPSLGLHEERFLPDSDGIWSKITPTFPYMLSVLRLVRKIYQEIDFEKVWTGELKRGLRSANFPHYYFRDEKLRTEARLILEKLAKRFQNNCKVKHQTCFIILLPDIDYLEGDFRAEQMMAFYFQNLRKQPFYFDMTEFLRAEMMGDFCRYIVGNNCQGHFNEAGYDIVSEFFLRDFPVEFEN